MNNLFCVISMKFICCVWLSGCCYGVLDTDFDIKGWYIWAHNTDVCLSFTIFWSQSHTPHNVFFLFFSSLDSIETKEKFCPGVFCWILGPFEFFSTLKLMVWFLVFWWQFEMVWFRLLWTVDWNVWGLNFNWLKYLGFSCFWSRKEIEMFFSLRNKWHCTIWTKAINNNAPFFVEDYRIFLEIFTITAQTNSTEKDVNGMLVLSQEELEGCIIRVHR